MAATGFDQTTGGLSPGADDGRGGRPAGPAAALPLPRPRLTFRIGVTGAREIPKAQAGPLAAEIAYFAGVLKGELAKLAVHFEPDENGRTFCLRLVSPVADGADRLAVEATRGFIHEVYAPLPFPLDLYEKTFLQVEPEKQGDGLAAASSDSLRSALHGATVLELDGVLDEVGPPGRGPLAQEAFVEVGQFVARNCDILIAVWDGAAKRLPGGTSDIVQFAARVGLPVWRIDPSGKDSPGLIRRAADLRDLGAAGGRERAAAALIQFLRRSLTPPEAGENVESDPFAKVARRYRAWRGTHVTPLQEAYSEGALADWPQWRAYDWMMDRIAPEKPAEREPAAVGAIETYWREVGGIADELSIAYGRRYRSSYVLIAAFAFLALLVSLTGLIFRLGPVAEALLESAELALLLGVAALVVANYLRRWHGRWFSYRLLAELCRKQAVLGKIGRSLPISEVTRIALMTRETAGGRRLPAEAWVAWYFTAALRAAPVPSGRMDLDMKIQEAEAGLALIEQQRRYHRRRYARSQRAAEALSKISAVGLLAGIALCAAKMVATWGEAPQTTALLSGLVIVVAALSAASVGIRAYSEFSLLERQSVHMRRALREAAAEIHAIPLEEPLASRELGRALYALTMAMLRDVAGWAQLFRVKVVEPG